MASSKHQRSTKASDARPAGKAKGSSNAAGMAKAMLQQVLDARAAEEKEAAAVEAQRTARAQRAAEREIAGLKEELEAAKDRIEELEEAIEREVAKRTIHRARDRAAQATTSDVIAALRLGAFHTTRLGNQIPAAVSRANSRCEKPNPALLSRFEAGLRSVGLSLADVTAPESSNHFMIVFHGTRSPAEILCRGFEPSQRSRQQYGPGEYFAEDWSTAASYATQRYSGGPLYAPAVIATLVVVAKAKRVNDTWFVVNNPIDGASTFCMPLVALAPNSYSSLVLPPCRCGDSATIVRYRDDNDQFSLMSAADSTAVAAAWRNRRGSNTATLRIGKWTYEYNWARMTQRNLSTGKVRTIRIDAA
uniref:WWE domain-containing protein n=1 Tax=Neobodo designis TaxID=312471 RepID=A0A7S1MAA9_NEODS